MTASAPPSPLITIIIPTFNPGDKLDETLRSIESQNVSNLEVLVQDGGSTDGTVEHLKTLQSPLNVRWHSERDKGIYDAMNRAIGHAQGRFIIFMGAGDIFMDNALAEVVAQLPAEAGTHFVYGNVLMLDHLIYDGEFSLLKMHNRNVCHQAIFYEKTVFERLGGYELRYPILADWAFNLRCFGDKSIKKLYIPVTVSKYEGGGVSDTGKDANFINDRVQLIRRHLGFQHFLLTYVYQFLVFPYLDARQALRRIVLKVVPGLSKAA